MIAAIDEEGFTILHKAIQFGSLEKVRQVLKFASDI